jgi:hypothetical protein
MARGCLALLLIVTTSISATQSRSTDISALVLQLGDPKTEWKAASQLQKVGTPAVAFLVQRLRQDGFRDRDHGNHSPTMRALEKIGEPAVPEIDRALTPALLRSADPEDARFVETAVLALTAIGGSVAAPSLVRAGVSAGDVRAARLPSMESLPPGSTIARRDSTDPGNRV